MQTDFDGEKVPWMRIAQKELRAGVRESTSILRLAPIDFGEARNLAEMGIRKDRFATYVDRSNPEVEKYYRAVKVYGTGDGKQVRDPADNVAWCAAFVNWCLQEAGLRGTGSAAASDFLRYGIGLMAPLEGCIAVVNRKGGKHVAFVRRCSRSSLTLLGGNQGNAVSESSAYGLAGAVFRWPNYPPFSQRLLLEQTTMLDGNALA